MLNKKLAFILLFACHFCQAQVSNAYFHHLTTENGLSQAINYFFYKDSRGFVWISSVSGLNCFDGRQIRVYQPELADTNALFGQNIQSPFLKTATVIFGLALMNRLINMSENKTFLNIMRFKIRFIKKI